MNKEKHVGNTIASDIRQMIETSRQNVAIAVNSEITLLYWEIGKRINEEVLGNERAEYGKQVVIEIGQLLIRDYGGSFSEKNLRRMMQFALVFSDKQIVVSAIRQLSWTHFIALIPLKSPIQREFYIEMCKVEQWNVKILREKIDSMLFERTAISKKPDELIEKELRELREENKVTPDLVFRSPYFLDFLGLTDKYSEKNLEDAILSELEYFILELGQSFSFIQRQKNMVIDGEDFKLDLLFFHRKLRRLIAIELKLGKFKAAYKGQMELYLRWLEKYEMQDGEETPIGLILCAEGNREQVELLQLDKSGIKLAEYLTSLPSQELLQQKLHQAVEIAKNKITS